MDKANELGHEPDIYIVDSYQDLVGDVEIAKDLKKVDWKVNGIELLYDNPLMPSTCVGRKLSNLNIGYIKYLLEHCVVTRTNYTGTNALGNMRGFGPKSVDKTINAIRIYEEQVVRQFKEASQVTEYLFYDHYDDKVHMVLDDLNEIVEYFVDNAKFCVWGEMNEAQKKELVYAIFRSKKDPLEKNIVNNIANYTTVSELERGIVKERTIDRFIVK